MQHVCMILSLPLSPMRCWKMLEDEKPTLLQMDIFRVSSSFNCRGGSRQNHLCNGVGLFYLYGDAIWTEECTYNFFLIVVATFKEFIHKFLKFIWMTGHIFSLLKEHMQALRLMLDQCRQLHISLNLKKCIFCTPFGTLLGHVVCKDGLLVNQANISTILDMVAPTLVCELCMRHWVIQDITDGSFRIMLNIATPLEKLLCKDTKYIWTQECQEALDTLKEKLVTVSISGFS
jgi:hypothetical protein